MSFFPHPSNFWISEPCNVIIILLELSDLRVRSELLLRKRADDCMQVIVVDQFSCTVSSDAYHINNGAKMVG